MFVQKRLRQACACSRLRGRGFVSCPSGVHQKVMITAPLVPAPCPAGNAGSGGGCRWLRPAIETAALASGNWPLTPDPAPWQWTCLPKVAIRTPGTDATAVPAARDFAVATVQRRGQLAPGSGEPR